MVGGLLRGDVALFQQAGDVLLPLLAQNVGPRQAAVAADDHQAVDAVDQQIAHRLQAAFLGAELQAARRADHGAAPVQDAAHAVPIHGADAVAAVDHALVAFVDGIDFAAAIECGAHDGAHGRIHPGRVATTGQNSKPFCHSIPILVQ